jgi:hypothetical protein
MKHMTWNWDAESRFAGTFVMTVTFRGALRLTAR